MKIFVFIYSFLLCLSAQAHTIEQQQQQQQQQHVITLTIAAPEIRPFIYSNEKGENKGLLIETINKLNASEKFKISVTIMPWARALKAVEQGKFDALMPTVYTPERSVLLSFPSKPLINFYGSGIFKRADDNFVYQSIPLIDKSKILVKVRSTKVDSHSEKAFSDALITFVAATRLEDAFNMLIYGHVDLLVADSAIAKTTINNMAINGQVDGFLLSDKIDSSFLAFSKQYSMSHDINAIMEEINVINDPDSYHLLSKN
ncbi:transporter substrate-binding domain-containing protein [Colwellia hornerae]|uniref:Transporter substrate-binding domain-containing protein n=1 Tax=Colwellia hornerae TaxID=89402 RepID=A0A5C6QQR5_9GAMM|nr:transporter substrate-binding domain-containing protein [Colwellia hornerae]TWX55657.1 transporter substrate-binding domain-containing protein [Colwellia hornerae]TWX61867.1 transporter substrate-binding domain-containing protein [Colwellia hornerae]TWX71199.1 transporter substrate-binding domain-containing protein [Colwellia hornerae]